MVEVTAVGESARERYRAALTRFSRLLEEGREYAAEGDSLPPDTARFAIGGATSMIFDEIRAGRGPELERILPDLVFAVLMPYLGPEAAEDEMRRVAAKRGDGLDPGAAAALPGRESGGTARRHLEDLAADPMLEREPLLERHAGTLDRGAAIGEHRLLREGGDLLGELERALEVAAGSDDLVDEPDPLGLLRVDGPAGEDQLQRPPHADDQRQPLGPAVDQRHSPAALEQAEGRAGRRDPQVAPQRQLDPSREAPAVDGGDRRLRRRHPGRAHRPLGMVDVEIERLQVGARAERVAAGSGEDEDARLDVGLEVAQALTQQLGRRRVDRVAALGPVDRQHRRRADALVANSLSHGGKSRERAG